MMTKPVPLATTGTRLFGRRRKSAIAPAPPAPSRRSLRGLDWFVFCVADVQTGFGPFVAVYLTTQKWTQTDIGLVLTVAGLVALVCQIPGGMLVDAARSERLVAGIAVTAIALSALTYALFPVFPAILAAAVTHATASCVLGPAMAAISLGLVGHAGIGERLGRNARFASVGNGFAAALMGACGYFFAARSVFVVTAVLLIPTMLALRHIAPGEINPQRAHGGPAEPTGRAGAVPRSVAAAIASAARLLRRAVPSRQRRDAAADGKRLDQPFARLGHRPDRHLHRRTATSRRADRALGRPPGANPGAPPSPASGICRACHSRHAVCGIHRSGHGRCRSAARRRQRRGARRHGAADRRGYHPRHRPLQFLARRRRHGGRRRRGHEHDAGRHPDRLRRQPIRVLRTRARSPSWPSSPCWLLMPETRPAPQS